MSREKKLTTNECIVQLKGEWNGRDYRDELKLLDWRTQTYTHPLNSVINGNDDMIWNME